MAHGNVVAGLSALPGLTTLRQPVLLLDARAHVVFANQAGRSFLGGGGSAHPLQANTAPATSHLRATVALVAHAPVGASSSQLVTLLHGARRPVALLLLQWREGEVLAIVHEPAAAPPADATRFQMTGAESALAADLLQGMRLKQIAQLRGRSLNTIRSQLSSVMKKTNTSSQADLVRVLMQPAGGEGDPRR